MKAITKFSALWILGIGVAAQAQQPEHKMHEHPAVLVKRQQAHKGYDYSAQFYPHPAWLYLVPEPRPMMEHPAVVVARRAEEERRAAAERASAETAWLAAGRH
jgi:hypothetical protein